VLCPRTGSVRLAQYFQCNENVEIGVARSCLALETKSAQFRTRNIGVMLWVFARIEPEYTVGHDLLMML